MDLNFKRAAETPPLPPPKRKKLEAVPPPLIDLNYPFWYTEDPDNGGGGGGSTDPPVNPPFLKPDGPLYTDNGLLGVRVIDPVIIAGKSIALGYGPSFSLNPAKRLQLAFAPSSGLTQDGTGVKIDIASNSALTLTEEGLNIATDESLQVDDNWELGIKPDPAGPLDVTVDGLNINLDPYTLEVTDDDAGQKKELGVKLKPSGVINSDPDGLDVDHDNTLKITTSTGGHGQLGVNVNAVGGLTTTSGLAINYDPSSAISVSQGMLTLNASAPISTSAGSISLVLSPSGGVVNTRDGLALNIDTETLSISENKLTVIAGSGTELVPDNRTITLKNGKLSVMFKPNGYLFSDTAGIALQANTTDFYDDGTNGLSLKMPGNYLSPYCTYEVGSSKLTTFDGYVMSETQKLWPCAYYVYMSNSGGIVNGMLLLRLDRSQIKIGMGTPANPWIPKFTFVITPSEDVTLGWMSIRQSPTLNPKVDKTKTFFIPNKALDSYSFVSIDYADWYNGANQYGTQLKFKPTGQAGVETFEATVNYYSATVVKPQTTSPPPVIVFDFTTPLNNEWYGASSGSIFTGAIYFTYFGQMPNYYRV